MTSETKPESSLLKLWEGFSKEPSLEKLSIELEAYKKLLRFFQAGEHYYTIFNLSIPEFETTSADIEAVLGYPASGIDLRFWVSLVHPEDLAWFNTAEHETAKFLLSLPAEKLPNYKVQYDLRFKTKKGNYRRILCQVVVIQQHEDGTILRTLSLQTDITHLKPTGAPLLSFIGLEGEPSFIDVKIGKPLIPFKPILTEREKEILSLLMQGKSNKQIAAELNLSKQTVDRHRKNMLNKTNTKNSAELITLTIKNGWA